MLKFLINRTTINGILNLNPFYSLQTLPLLQPFSTTTTTAAAAAAATLTQLSNPDFIEYLIKSLNFTPKQAHKISAKISHIRQIKGSKNITQFTTLQLQNSNNVISYLQQIGVQHSLILNTISSVPKILFCKVDKTLKPRREFFQKLGFSGSDFIQFLKAKPSLMFSGLETCIIPTYHNLKEILGCDRFVVILFKKFPNLWLNTVSKTLVPNVALLRSYGIPIAAIQKRILRTPATFFRNPKIFEEAVIRVEVMFGIPRDSPQFLVGIQLLTSLKPETLEAKKEIFQSFGWRECDIVELFKSNPMCFVLSSDRIKKKLRFLMADLGYKAKFLISNTSLFTSSLEKRIVPRYKVLVMLKEKGVIKMDYSLATFNCLKEDRFLEMFVIPYKDVHEVYAKHCGICLEKSREYRN